MAYKRLGDVLIDAGLITEDQLGHALKQQKETKRRLGDELIAEGVITEAGLIEALQMQALKVRPAPLRQVEDLRLPEDVHIGLIVRGIALAAGLVIANWGTLGPYFKQVWDYISPLFEAGWELFKTFAGFTCPRGFNGGI